MKYRCAYAYIRVSTDRQEELSPDSQKKLLQQYAEKNAIVILQFFYEIGVSGRSAGKRPAFLEMIGSAKSPQHPIDVILVWKFSRFARNQEESIVYKSLLKKQHNVDVVSISEPLIDGPFGSLIERIIEWMDEYYSIRLSGEVFRGMKENAVRGAFQSRPPLGYKVAERGKPPVIVPEEAEIVQLIFQMYVNGSGFFHIAKHLNALGLHTSQGKPFERRSVEYIVQNPIYCGLIRWNRMDSSTNTIKDRDQWIMVPGKHQAIISRELFDQAQLRLQTTKNPKGSRPSNSCRHFLSGLLKCPDCGRTLTASAMRRRNGQGYFYFSCSGYRKGKCQNPNGISSLVLEKEFLAALKEVYHTQTSEYRPKKQVPQSRISQSASLQKQLDLLSAKESRIKRAYREGIDTLEEYKENKHLIQVEREHLDHRLTALSAEQENAEATGTSSMPAHRKTVYEILCCDQYTAAQKNQILRRIIDKIVYNRREDTLRIYYICHL